MLENRKAKQTKHYIKSYEPSVVPRTKKDNCSDPPDFDDPSIKVAMLYAVTTSPPPGLCMIVNYLDVTTWRRDLPMDVGYITEWNPTSKLTAYRGNSKIQIEPFHIFCDLEQESKDFGKKTTLEVEFGDFKHTIDDIFRQNAYQRNHIWNFFIALTCSKVKEPRLILSVCLDKEPTKVLEVQIQFIEGNPPPGPLSSY